MATTAVKIKHVVEKFSHFELAWVGTQSFTKSTLVVKNEIKLIRKGTNHVSKIIARILFFKRLLKMSFEIIYEGNFQQL